MTPTQFIVPAPSYREVQVPVRNCLPEGPLRTPYSVLRTNSTVACIYSVIMQTQSAPSSPLRPAAHKINLHKRKPTEESGCCPLRRSNAVSLGASFGNSRPAGGHVRVHVGAARRSAAPHVAGVRTSSHRISSQVQSGPHLSDSEKTLPPHLAAPYHHLLSSDIHRAPSLAVVAPASAIDSAHRRAAQPSRIFFRMPHAMR